MPKENIEKAINGKSVDASKLQSITYEGFGPGSCAIIVDCLTGSACYSLVERRKILQDIYTMSVLQQGFLNKSKQIRFIQFV